MQRAFPRDPCREEVGYLPPPPGTGTVNTIEVIPNSISWQQPRRLGDVYVALRAWQHLGLDRLMQRLLATVATRVPMPLVAALIAINRLVEPRSERGIFHWPTIEKHLAEQAGDLFSSQNDLLLYDLTSTYFEGRLDQNPKAQRGYSRDHRPDCKQLCLGLVVNRDGFPLGYESLPGNRSDATTLLSMIEILEARFGICSRIICFDRGMATEENLRQLRLSKRTYLCGSRRAVVRQHLPVIRSGPWTVIRSSAAEQPTIEVQELPPSPSTAETPEEPKERWLLCRSAGCRQKEQQMYEARLAKARQRLAKLQQQVAVGTFTTAHVILAKARKAVGRTHDLQGIFTFALRQVNDKQELHVAESASAIEDERDLQGVYLLRTTVVALTPPELWHMYMLLTRVESAFRNLKTDLCIRPIYHQKENRGDAHVLFSVLAYALSVTLRLRSGHRGSELSTTALLETVEGIQLAELSYQTSDGHRLRFERASVPSSSQQAVLEALGWPIPERYLPPNLEVEPRRVV